ncbi:ring finger protein 207 [Columba livia]|uniref:RING finger protein 207 n=1 Tax=Columba livia TaxID=8932 RepID=A0A2I0LIN5_COLLI|nr:ring finger protein 207 [Columba livia]
MAGGIFSPLGSCSELEKANCHPLVCLLCHEPYQHPCLLDCYHNFCASCLRGRASDGRLCCPLCGHPSVVRGGTGLPPVDRLLQFLVDSSADGEEDVQCANCDRCCAKAELDTMYFCNTCGQPLCAPCREEVLLKAMIEEVRNSASEEEAAINSLFGRMQEQLSERKKTLLKAVQSQHEEKEKAFKEQLAHLASLLPTLQVHLVTCSAFLSSANKAEFLHGGAGPARRSRQERTNRRCRPWGPLLTPGRAQHRGAELLGLPARAGERGAARLPGSQCSKTLMVPGCPPVGDKMSTSPMVRKPTMHRYISTKVLLAEGRETPFAEHCRNYENTYRMLQTEIQGLKDQVQELHRDLTKHHSLIKTEIMSEILQKSLQMDVQIAAHYSAVEMMRSVFEEVWEETYQRVANEQEIYEAQLHDLLQLRQENRAASRLPTALRRERGQKTARPRALLRRTRP